MNPRQTRLTSHPGSARRREPARLRMRDARAARDVVRAVLFLLAALTLSPAGCGSDPLPPDTPILPGQPRQVLHDVEMRQTSMKGLLWILRADVAVSRAEEEPLELTGLTVLFHDGDEQVRSTLTSRHGRAHPKRSRLIASDSVVVVTAAGERLETEYLEWDPEKERVTTPEPFRLTRAQDVVTGVGIESDPDLKHYVVHSQLRVEILDTESIQEMDQ